MLDWRRDRQKIVGPDCDAALRAEYDADLEKITFIDGRLAQRVGVAKRIAECVKMRMHETPRLTRANMLVASRYIQDAMDDAGITRHKDRVEIYAKARALVFVRDRDLDMATDRFLNCRAAVDLHEQSTGWGHWARVGWFGWRKKVRKLETDQ